MSINEFTLHFTNIQGLSSNYNYVELHLNQHNPAIFACNETQVSDVDAFSINGYSLVSMSILKKGLAIYIRSDIAYSTIPSFHNSNPMFQYMCLKICAGTQQLFLIFVYISPSISYQDHVVCLEDLSERMNSLIVAFPKSEIILAGDFNAHNMSWLKFSSGDTEKGLELEFFASNFNLTQLVSEPTRIPHADNQNRNLLDLFLTTCPEKYNVVVLAPLGSSDHCVVTASFQCSNPSVDTPPPKRTIWQYKNAKWDELNHFLKSFDWSICFRHKNVDTAANIITNTILLGMKLFIPSSKKKVSKKKEYQRLV